MNQFGNPVSTQTFDTIRVADPFNRRGPNWDFLPANANIVRPSDAVLQRFKELLDQRIAPGPRYIDLVNEIWSRGFEVFLVGGTVRDVLSNHPSKDVDIVTTMPLIFMRRFIRSMYRYEPTAKDTRGFMRIGGTPESGDPFIDLKVFSDSLPGTRDATFGVGFERDAAHRDFACNAVYFDPVNGVLIDPSGHGIDDAIDNRLTLVCQTNDPFQNAQLFVRFFKFRARGFECAQETLIRICSEFVSDLTAMASVTRAEYVRAQVLSKSGNKDEQERALNSLQEHMTQCGVGHVWDEQFAPAVKVLLNE